jgi:hypothetical protein
MLEAEIYILLTSLCYKRRVWGNPRGHQRFSESTVTRCYEHTSGSRPYGVARETEAIHLLVSLTDRRRAGHERCHGLWARCHPSIDFLRDITQHQGVQRPDCMRPGRLAGPFHIASNYIRNGVTVKNWTNAVGLGE